MLLVDIVFESCHNFSRFTGYRPAGQWAGVELGNIVSEYCDKYLLSCMAQGLYCNIKEHRTDLVRGGY